MARVTTKNYPHRLDRTGKRRREDFGRMSAAGVTVIAVQEVTDADAGRITPKGWRVWRPAAAESAAVLWDASVWTLLRRGRKRISSKGWTPVREIVWVRLRNRKGTERVFASVHLVAFKTSKKRNGAEFRRQVQRAADWLSGQPRSAVLMGDFNGTPGDGWMTPLERVALHSAPLYRTGPSGQRIDYGWKRRGARTRAKGVRRWPKAGSDHYGAVLDV